MRRWPVLFLLACSLMPAMAAEAMRICYGYSCVAEAEIRYSSAQLAKIADLLGAASDAAEERAQLALAMGRLYAWAGEQSDIHNDRAGNYADGHAPGKMDCIDHSTSSTRLLQMLERRGLLRWHRVREPQARYFLWLIANHWSAVIEETGGDAYVVDSWFVNNGEPAVILPLDAWKKGAGPNV